MSLATGRGPGRRIAEAIVQPELDEVDIGIDIDARQAEAAQIVRPARQIDVVIFELGAPVAADGKFDAGARGPAELVLSGRRDDVSAAVIDVDVAMSPGEAAGHIGQPRSERVADAAAHGADIVDRRVEGRWRQCAGRSSGLVNDASASTPSTTWFGELPVVADLVAADQAGDAVRKEHALLGKRIGAGTETAAAVADMAAEIKSGPVVDGFERRRLDRQVRGECGAVEREQAQAHARDYALPGSAAAVHRVDVSSANIPAVSFVTLQICRRAATNE